MKENSKKLSNTKEEYDEAVAVEDPTNIDNQALENLAKEAMKKFKALD